MAVSASLRPRDRARHGRRSPTLRGSARRRTEAIDVFEPSDPRSTPGSTPSEHRTPARAPRPLQLPDPRIATRARGSPRRSRSSSAPTSDIGGREPGRHDHARAHRPGPARRRSSCRSRGTSGSRSPAAGSTRSTPRSRAGSTAAAPQLMAKTVANLTGLRIDHFAVRGPRRLPGDRRHARRRGHVHPRPTTPTRTTGPDPGSPSRVSTSSPAARRSTAYQALAYVRTRHLPCDTIPDFARISRQQQFLRAVINQLLQPSEARQGAHPRRADPDEHEARRAVRARRPRSISSASSRGSHRRGGVPRRSRGVGGLRRAALSVVHMDPAADEIFDAIREGKPICRRRRASSWTRRRRSRTSEVAGRRRATRAARPPRSATVLSQGRVRRRRRDRRPRPSSAEAREGRA